MPQLANQIAVITGAGRGIGRAIALKFAAEGADIACVSRTAENAEKVAAEIRLLGRRAWAYAVDVADSAAVAAAAEKILQQTGKVDILVNNAGVTRDGLIMRMSEADWDAVLNTNLKGAFLFTQALSRGFLKQRSGRILNIASVIGLMGNAGQCNYAASKAGLDRLHQVDRQGIRLARRDRQRPGAGLHRDGYDGGVDARSCGRNCSSASPCGRWGSRRTSRRRRLFLAGPGRALHHRAGIDRGWRDGDVDIQFCAGRLDFQPLEQAVTRAGQSDEREFLPRKK